MSRYGKPQQHSFDDIEVGMSALPIRPGSFVTRFRDVCARLIPDSIFEKLYSNVGREARSASALTRLLLLQLRDGTSDERIVDDLYYDLRVRHVCDFALDQRPIHPTNLVYHRLRRREYLEDVAKPKIDWESDSARAELLNDLLYDAVSVLRASLSFDDDPLQGLLEQLARLVGQDVEVSEDGTGKIRHFEGVARVVLGVQSLKIFGFGPRSRRRSGLCRVT